MDYMQTLGISAHESKWEIMSYKMGHGWHLLLLLLTWAVGKTKACKIDMKALHYVILLYINSIIINNTEWILYKIKLNDNNKWHN